MARLPRPTRLVIAGAGPLEKELRSLSKALELERCVRFLGFESDVRHWMQVADGFVLSSRLEGLPMSLLEAAACCLPTVATDVPGTREVVIQGKTGWLAEAGNPQALRDTMARMMETSPEERRAMGECARQNALDRFSLETVLDRWQNLYTDLLTKSSRPKRFGA